MKPNRAIVVGGGLAGCSAALALARSDVQVTLIEARRKLGGRAGSFRAKSDSNGESTEIDYCQHVGMGCCTNLVQLIDWLGQKNDWKRYRDLHFYSSKGQHQHLKALPFLPAPAHLATWLLRWPGLRARDRMSVARGMLKINRIRDLDALDTTNAQQWLIDAGQSQRAIDSFWGTIIVSALGESIERASMAAVCKVMQDGFLRHRDAFHLLVPSRPLGQLFGADMESALQASNVRLHLGETVQTVKTVADTRSRPIVAYGTGDQERQEETDAIVLAMPWHQTSRLIDTSNTRAVDLRNIASEAAKLESSPISGIHTWWDGPWLPHDHAAIVDRLSQWVFHHRSSDTPTGETYYQIVVSASRNLPRARDHEALRKLIYDDLAEVFPAVRKRKLLRIKTVTDPNAVFSFGPGTLAHRPKQRISEGIVVAGDWVANGWPATMEGAILSGFRAADLLLGNCGTARAVEARPLGETHQGP